MTSQLTMAAIGVAIIILVAFSWMLFRRCLKLDERVKRLECHDDAVAMGTTTKKKARTMWGD